MGILQPMDAATRRVVAVALRAQPGTLHYVAEADEQATVYGVAGQIPVTGYLGNAGWTGYGMVSGRWYSGPGQVDVPAYFLAVTGRTIGDTVTMAFAGRQIPVRIVGEIFGNQNNGLAMVTDWQTLASADPGLEAGGYDVGAAPGHVAVRLRAADPGRARPGIRGGREQQQQGPAAGARPDRQPRRCCWRARPGSACSARWCCRPGSARTRWACSARSG